MTGAPPANYPSWQILGQLATARVGETALDFPLSVDIAGLHIDFSRQRIDRPVLNALVDLAHEADLSSAIEALFLGEAVNVTEHRAALHTALRANNAQRPKAVKREIEQAALRQANLVETLRAGRWRGYTNKPIRHVVHVGIGGSHLGPELVNEALGPSRGSGPSSRSGPIDCCFLANIDSHAIAEVLAGLDPETTLFIIASKSFSTTETLENAISLRSWFLERVADANAIPRHFIAVTANLEAAVEFGIEAANVFPMWDWIGGRFSLWSSVGLPIAVQLGNSAFAELLDGARQMDEHFRSAPPTSNGPLLMALAGIWNTNFLGAQSHALLCYERRLAGLVTYLQQLEMESNGKTSRRGGERTEVHTAPIVWGGEETNGQHAFHQLLHQGSRAFSADFIACVEPPLRPASRRAERHHRWLLSNLLGQGEAMQTGAAKGTDHQHIVGRHPSTTILLDQLSPTTLGALLALYEHKVYCQGMIWDINPFDQWGVELGKQLGASIHAELDGESARTRNPATRRLVDRIRGGRSTEQ